MFLPAGLALAGSAIGAAALKAVQPASGDLAILSLYSNLPAWAFAGGIAIAVAIAGIQTIRLRLWDRGAIPGCYVCGCLLAPPRAARHGLGLARRCLGCGKLHGVNHHRLMPRVVPLAVAVKDAAGQVRSVRSSP
jgi:hypothetical protein